MRIAVLIPAGPPQRWHVHLAETLLRVGTVSLVPSQATAFSVPVALRLLLLLDRTLHGGAVSDLDAAAGALLADGSAAAPAADVIVDLTGEASDDNATAPAGSRRLVPLFDGAPGEAGLWSALLDRRAPQLQLADRRRGMLLEIGLPALETPLRLTASANAVLARLQEGIVQAVADLGRPAASHPNGPVCAPSGVRVLGCAAAVLSGKAARVLGRILKTGPQWAVAMCPVLPGPRLPPAPLDAGGWTFLCDDGARYFADPFLSAAGGDRHLFVEEYPYATGRGLISVCALDASGRPGRPRPVLEAAHHLSYPQILEDDGALYMLPEAAASGRLTLYRAERFPDRWQPVADLLDLPVHDATVIRHEGVWWMFAATQAGASSTWDALSLFSAPSLLGPWTAHARNPVLLDAAQARPAGDMFVADGHLWRPAQDCTDGYGAGMTLARIDRLDASGFAQSAVHRWRARRPAGLLGPHTWNVGAGISAIDLFGPRRALFGA